MTGQNLRNHFRLGNRWRRLLCCSPLALSATGADNQQQQPTQASPSEPQYDSTHVYVAPGDLDAFVKSFIATFGGQTSKQSVTNVLPVPSSAEFQYLWTSVGTLSVFAFQTPIPFPFGEERTGYLVTDMDQAIRSARAAGAEVIVEPFKDPIGSDAVIQWRGGMKMQLYWHFTAPKYAPLETIPDNRVYVSRDDADNFVERLCTLFSRQNCRMTMQADAGEIGRAGRDISPDSHHFAVRQHAGPGDGRPSAISLRPRNDRIPGAESWRDA